LGLQLQAKWDLQVLQVLRVLQVTQVRKDLRVLMADLTQHKQFSLVQPEHLLPRMQESYSPTLAQLLLP
jgi:uncharacterized protein (DUF885 family)